MYLLGFIAAFALTTCARADVRGCACDPSRPETMQGRECSLCREAQSQPPGTEFFYLKDINPRKPNRWLALIRSHAPGGHPLHELPKEVRVRFWNYAIADSRQRFGDQWGVAYNGARVRTQCHFHVHLGRFIRAAENSNFRTVRRVEEFPAPEDTGLLIHPVPGGYHVHTGEQIMETALVR